MKTFLNFPGANKAAVYLHGIVYTAGACENTSLH